jgi:hypothetical protein
VYACGVLICAVHSSVLEFAGIMAEEGEKAPRRVRGPMTVNPVTGKLQAATVKAGMHRDGMLQVTGRCMLLLREGGEMLFWE